MAEMPESRQRGHDCEWEDCVIAGRGRGAHGCDLPGNPFLVGLFGSDGWNVLVLEKKVFISVSRKHR